MTRILLSTMLALSVSACSISPKPLTSGALASFASDKLARVTAGQEPITKSVTLYEAMARALKYNLDFHVELYNEALASKQVDVARGEMLPTLVQNMSYTGRSNDSGNKSSTVFPDRNKFQEDVTLSWNVLDFGLSKVRAEQAADEVLVARERRRKIINRVIEDVRTAYWRAVSADRLVSGLRKLEGRAQRALKNSSALQNDGQTSPLTALTYQRELVEIQQRIQRLQKDLSLAKMQLAALMNVAPGESFVLAQPKRRVNNTKIEMSADEMIFTALENRPELRDIQYQLRINSKEVKSEMLQLLPSLNVFANFNVDTDTYLLNSNWLGFGVRATSNLLNAFKFPKKKKAIQAKDEVLDARALAVTMAIMTQIHVSRVRYAHSRKLYLTAAKHLKVQNGIVKQIRASHAEGQASEQTLIREEMNTLASQVSSDIAYSDLQNAYANIYASMGVDPYAGNLGSNESVDQLTASLREVWLERGDSTGKGYVRHAVANHKASTATITGSIKKSKDPFVADTRGWEGKDVQPAPESTPQIVTVEPRKGIFSSRKYVRPRKVTTYENH